MGGGCRGSCELTLSTDFVDASEMVVLLPLSATVQRSDVQRWEIFLASGA